MPNRVVVLDYGLGNLRSVQRALEAAGASIELSTQVKGDRLVLPGVGAFAQAVQRLQTQWGHLQQYLASGRPLLGICLGMQLLFERGYEHGDNRGLEFFRGEVTSLPRTVTVPNMGWHQLAGLGNPFVYFAHSYAVASCPDAAATFDHGGSWVAVAKRGPVWGFQFHPEKSGDAGIQLLRDWLQC